MPRFLRFSAKASDFSIETVPTRIGWLRLRQSSMRLMMASGLFGHRAVDFIFHIVALHGDVGRDFDDFEAVDLAEFAASVRAVPVIARKLRVKTEIILERDRGERLVLALDRDMFLGFKRQMQTVRNSGALPSCGR